MNTFFQDLRYGLRMMLKKPSFTVIAVITLALGIGANTAIFSLISAVLVRPLNYFQPERLVMVWEDNSAAGFPHDTPAPANYADWKAQNHVFEDMAAIDERSYDLTGDGGEPEQLFTFGVSNNFFPLLGVNPALGRNFTSEEDQAGADKVVILSHSLWQTRFGGERSIIGRKILLNGEQYNVIGVMPEGFQFEMPNVQLWVPIALTPAQLTNRHGHYLNVVARLQPHVTAEQANADIKAITARIAAAFPDDAEGMSAAVVPMREQLTGNVRRPLMILLVAVGFVLLIACANIAGLLLSRAAARKREIAVRVALGASRWRIVRQLLTESILLGSIGGLLGLLLAMWTLAFLQQLIPAGMREMVVLKLDVTVLVFTLFVSLVAGLILGLAPAWQASKTDLNTALKEGSGRTGFGSSQRWLRSTFVVLQVALAMVLLVGAGLLIQTLSRLRSQYSELRPEQVLTMQTQLAKNRYADHSKRTAFYDQVLERVKNLPGVISAGYTTSVPLIWKGGGSGLIIEGREAKPGINWNANNREVSPDYFQTMGIAIKQGRTFTAQDNEHAMPVAIINETMARQYWPNENPLGKRFKLGSEVPWIEIVGVVADVRQMGADAPVKAEMYFPYWQGPQDSFFPPRDLVIRTSVAPMSIVPAVRRAIHDVDPYQPISNLRTMDEVLGRETAQRRMEMILLTAFAALALLLSTLGIYGVLSHFVVEHTPEIGVRMALGAQTRDVLRLVLGKGMRLALLGVALGLVGAFALMRLIESLLFEVKATDPLTFFLIALLLTVVALAACLIPARKAMKVDPMVALRYE